MQETKTRPYRQIPADPSFDELSLESQGLYYWLVRHADSRNGILIRSPRSIKQLSDAVGRSYKFTRKLLQELIDWQNKHDLAIISYSAKRGEIRLYVDKFVFGKPSIEVIRGD